MEKRGFLQQFLIKCDSAGNDPHKGSKGVGGGEDGRGGGIAGEEGDMSVHLIRSWPKLFLSFGYSVEV